MCAHVDDFWLPVMPVGPEDESRLRHSILVMGRQMAGCSVASA